MSASLEITTVSFCKNVCTYCPQTLLLSKYGKKEYMTIETFKTCVNKLPKHVILVFAGYAEPFLNKDASDMMVYAFDNGFQVCLNTTLVGLRQSDIEKLKGKRFLNISLHLPDNEKAMKAVVDEAYIKNAHDFAYKIGYTNCHVYGSLHKDIVHIFMNCDKRTLTDQHLHTRANNVDDKANLTKIEKTTGPIQCDVVLRRKDGNIDFNFNVLLPNGDVTICCMDYGLKHKFGNLLVNSYEDLFKSEEYLKVQAGLKDDKIDILCRTCKEGKQI